MKTMYEVSRNAASTDIQEVQYVKVSESFGWRENGMRDKLDTSYHLTFETKEEAIKYLNGVLESRVRNTQHSLAINKKTLEDFQKQYSIS